MSRDIQINHVRAPEWQMSPFERGLAKVGLYKWAMNRSLARYEFEAQRAYLEAAKNDRLTANWGKITAKPNEVYKSDGRTVRDRARWHVMNNSFAARAKQVMLDWTVGTGISSQSQIAYSRDGAENSKLNQVAEDRKKLWLEQADFTGHSHWYELQEQVLGQVIEDGACLLRRRYISDKNRVLPLAYELVELDRLTDYSITTVGNGNQVIGGKEVDADGRPVAYHVLYGEYNTKTVRIPASEIYHIYRRDRPGQQHGLSWFTPVLADLQQFNDIKFYRLVANKVQSAIAVIVSQDEAGRSVSMPGLNPAAGASSTGAAGDAMRYLEPGMIHRVGTGKVTPFLPNPSTDLDVLTKTMLRGVAVGLGISYEWLTGDYSMVNFSGGRLTRQDCRKRILPIHAFHCRHVETPVHRDWVDAELAFGTTRKPKPGIDPYAVHFSLPRADSGVNPLQDANAAITLMGNNLTTMRDYYEQQGLDWMEALEQIANEKEAMKQILGTVDAALTGDQSNG